MNDRNPLQAAYRCETGAVRTRNEDACLVLTTALGGHFSRRSPGLYVVADGMGGHVEGHVASKDATRTFGSHVTERLIAPQLAGRPLPDEADVLTLLEDAVFAAHEAVYRPDPAENGGSTLTAVLALEDRLYIAHVGDSRAYLLSGGELRQLTTDHSLVRQLQDRGQLTADEAQEYEYRNVLLQALGQEMTLSVETLALEQPSGGRLLICSDGLSGVVNETNLQRILGSDGPPQQIADALYRAAMAAGGPDNITAVVVDFD